MLHSLLDNSLPVIPTPSKHQMFHVAPGPKLFEASVSLESMAEGEKHKCLAAADLQLPFPSTKGRGVLHPSCSGLSVCSTSPDSQNRDHMSKKQLTCNCQLPASRGLPAFPQHERHTHTGVLHPSCSGLVSCSTYPDSQNRDHME